MCAVYCICRPLLLLLLLSLFHVQRHSCGSQSWAVICPSLLPTSLERKPWHPLWIQRNQADKLQGPRPHLMGMAGRGQGGSWLEAGAGSGLSLMLASSGWAGGCRGLGRGDEVAEALRLRTCGSWCLLAPPLTRPLCVFTAQPGGGRSVWGGG